MAGVAQVWLTEQELDMLSRLLARADFEDTREGHIARAARVKIVGALDPVACSAECETGACPVPVRITVPKLIDRKVPLGFRA